ncbi:MAG TPA: molybdenum cofactor biosynthesis protein MoaE [Bacteroidales bacterium]|nr:molybdenum cofactor biosynthesis protein MoaE [Bacteroidales bacterium]HPF01630.1 molybdenum cofactor biosynthesis protein MoaE [Bacteroidales bacterium]HPJ60562.1 molybdenum cofactor biosynthesis protein MoaE [Bacteroidales bacterium]HPR13314.1 molybdenum cofactor biosynthesis protein MoaE [Bacteroidales bacterium]HRW85625.1 molybdenum cofactor biosynthesis protein MoaE [Bacteroidales bacterium]
MTGKILVEGPVTMEIISVVLSAEDRKNETGAYSMFLGRVRADNKGGRVVKAIEYSAYESMVNHEADDIKQAILLQFDDVVSLEILHSTGVVKAGEISLLVLVTGRRRHQAQRACAMIVEMIKERFPVWKKEIYEDNSREWQQPYLA